MTSGEALTMQTLLNLVAEAIGHGMPVTEVVAAARNSAVQILARHRDEDEPIDEAWLRSVGFKGKNNRSGLSLKGADYDLWAFCEPSWLIWAIGSQQIKAPANRGECRRLCSALGISLKEPTP